MVDAKALAIKTSLDQLKHRFPLEVNDLGKEAQGQRQPKSFVHKGATRLAPT
jgi:hypothetical protein